MYAIYGHFHPSETSDKTYATYKQNMSGAIRHSSVLITTPLKGKEKPKIRIH